MTWIITWPCWKFRNECPLLHLKLVVEDIHDMLSLNAIWSSWLKLSSFKFTYECIRKNAVNSTAGGIWHLSLTSVYFSLKNCMWVERVLAFAGVLREASWGLSCPFHCGGSWFVPFLAGCSVGLVLGILFSLVLAYHFFHWTSPLPAGHPPSDLGGAALLRRRARFSSYLHEWGGCLRAHFGYQ